VRVLHFENHRHVVMVSSFVDDHDDSISSHQPTIMSLDLRSTRFIAAPSVDLNPVLRRWVRSGTPTNPAVVINEFRKEHFARRLASGGYLIPEASRIQIVKATRRGIPVDTYTPGIRETEMDLRDSSGVRIGKAKWDVPNGEITESPNLPT